MAAPGEFQYGSKPPCPNIVPTTAAIAPIRPINVAKSITISSLVISTIIVPTFEGNTNLGINFAVM
jgi:hypothetical protein